MQLRGSVGLDLATLLVALQFIVPVQAQISGEILVGSTAAQLTALAAATDEPPIASQLPGQLAEPRSVTLSQPVYPRAARAARQEGRVRVCFTVDERGIVQMPAVRFSTDPVFDQPVLDAIRASRFTPARAGKQALRSTACRTFQFVLR